MRACTGWTGGCASGATRDIVRLVTPVLLELSHETEEPYALPRAVYNEIAAGKPAGMRAMPLEGEDAAWADLLLRNARKR